MPWIVVPVAVSSALFFSLSSVLKHRSAKQITESAAPDELGINGFVRRSMRHKLWLIGILTDAVALALQVLALHYGALSVVQPLLIMGLVFALILRRWPIRMDARELGWSLLLASTLAGFEFLARSSPTVTASGSIDQFPAAVTTAAALVLAVSCLALIRRRKAGSLPALITGVGIGVIYAATAALLKSVTDQAGGGVLLVLQSWQPYCLLLLGAAGVLLTQLAFRAGSLTASLPTMSVVDPLISIAIGVAVFDEHIRHTSMIGLMLAGLLVLLSVAVVKLTRAPQIGAAEVGSRAGRQSEFV